MNKFAVFSGFLGAGKTTTMMALTQYYSAHYGKAAMISNDLGNLFEVMHVKISINIGDRS